MDPNVKRGIIDNYTALLERHQDGPQVGQWSAEGQRFRFAKLCEIGDLRGRRVLDLGCGIGDLYPWLCERFGPIEYTGIDINPNLIAHATRKYPSARFCCQDVLEDPPIEKFDYVLTSGVFNNAIPDATAFLKRVVAATFDCCSTGMGFNFTSTVVNFTEAEIAYHDPREVFSFCLETLSRKVTLCHHYERCDVAVFVYR